MNEAERHTALEKWRTLLGPERVLSNSAGISSYTSNTLAVDRRVAAVLKPLDRDQVSALVHIAVRHRIPLYPVSTGHNWGYGSSSPTLDDCVVVDLASMRAIDHSEIGLGVVTVEPGVTQGMLRRFLDERDLPFLVPVHGGGSTCSLVGNALERGYGITPYADHFGAVTALEAVLPNGEIYHSALTGLEARTVDRAFKWGLGPYLDGLFTQGAFGIVTRMSIALAPIPERVETFFFGVREHAEFAEAVAAVREVLRTVDAVTGSINLMNSRRVLSMIEPYRTADVGPEGILPDETIAAMAQRSKVFDWTGIGALYGPASIVKAARSEIRKRLKGIARRLIFLTPQRVRQTRSFLERLPRNGGQRVWNYVNTLDKSLQLIAGAPSEVALPLAYWKSGTKPDANSGQPLNPDADGCGLIWYSPLVPMIPARVREFVDMVDHVCRRYGIEPLITLTSLSDRCFDSTVPLLFDRNDAKQAERAHACYRALLDAGQSIGCVPYRSSIEAMDWFVRDDIPHWRLIRQLKTALDPHDIIAPGRYCPPGTPTV